MNKNLFVICSSTVGVCEANSFTNWIKGKQHVWGKLRISSQPDSSQIVCEDNQAFHGSSLKVNKNGYKKNLEFLQDPHQRYYLQYKLKDGSIHSTRHRDSKYSKCADKLQIEGSPVPEKQQLGKSVTVVFFNKWDNNSFENDCGIDFIKMQPLFWFKYCV